MEGGRPGTDAQIEMRRDHWIRRLGRGSPLQWALESDRPDFKSRLRHLHLCPDVNIYREKRDSGLNKKRGILMVQSPKGGHRR